MTERQVQQALFHQNASACALMMPNYSPRNWFECDLFAVTRAGYFWEFEIKLTVADFRKDAQKSEPERRRYTNGQWEITAGTRKHDLLADRSPRGPKRFWYVMRDGLVELREIPEWAGLLVWSEDGFRNGWTRTAKDAPDLHRERIDKKVCEHARSVCYFRFWQERNRNDRRSLT